MAEHKDCFVICPIGAENSSERKWSDKLFEFVIDPITEELGYEALRAHKISEPGIITRQIIQRIIDAPLVIADLTGKNPNVFYELAIRHAIKKPLVQLIKKGEDIPFDLSATRVIFIDLADLYSVKEAKKELKKQISSVDKDDPNIDNPISVTIELQRLKSSGKPEERLFEAILTKLDELASTVSKLETQTSRVIGPSSYQVYQSPSESPFEIYLPPPSKPPIKIFSSPPSEPPIKIFSSPPSEPPQKKKR